MPIPARLQTVETRTDRRASRRHEISLGSEVGGIPIIIHDLSATGMLIETAANLHAFDAVEVDLPEVGCTSAFVIWHSGRYFGCEFKEPVFQAAVSAARLRSPPAVPVKVLKSHVSVDGALLSGERSGELPAQQARADEKAPLGVRLRVIFGSALLLWAAIVWAAVSLIRLIRSLLA